MTPLAGHRRRKALGQHFLRDARVADRQIEYAELEPDDVVLEIGPGTGFLTRRIAPRVARLIAIEKDSALAKSLLREFPESSNVRIVEADATRADLAAHGPFNKIVANLPYSVSSPITFQLLPLLWDRAVLMYQKEFADRLVAQVGHKDYGRLSAARAYFAAAEYLETVGRGAFQPPPEVSSAIVRLRRHRNPPFEVSSPTDYLELVRVLFSTRRKTIRSTLRHQARALGLASLDGVDPLLDAWGRGDARPEEVAPADLGDLSLRLARVKGHA